MATASRRDRSSPTLRMWCTVPRGTQTISSFLARKTMSPVSSHSRVPARTTHHSSNSRCQCGRLPPPGGLAMRVTSCRSSAMIRFDHGGGPIVATRSATRVWSRLGQELLAAVGGRGPSASAPMTIETAVSPEAMSDRPSPSVPERWIDAVEAPEQPRPHEATTAAGRPLRALQARVGIVEDFLGHGNQLAATRLRAHLDRARGLEVVHGHEGLGDGLAHGEKTVIAEDQGGLVAEIRHQTRLLVVTQGRALEVVIGEAGQH